MKLNEYLTVNHLPQITFSKQVNIGPIYLNALIRGRRKPSPALALRIEEATGGRVTRMELLYPEQNKGVAQGESPAT